MKVDFKLFTAAVLLLGIGNVQAQQSGGLTYRDSDPFLFCEQGQDIRKAPARCWMPTPPYTGGMAYAVMPHCWPNPYGKSWSQDDIVSLAQYQAVCPKGERHGEWDSKSGSKEMVPNWH